MTSGNASDVERSPVWFAPDTMIRCVGECETGDWSLQPPTSAAVRNTNAGIERKDMGGNLQAVGVRREKRREFQRPSSLAVRNPDVLHLRSGAEKFTTLAIGGVEPIPLVPRSPSPLHVRRRRK